MILRCQSTAVGEADKARSTRQRGVAPDWPHQDLAWAPCSARRDITFLAGVAKTPLPAPVITHSSLPFSLHASLLSARSLSLVHGCPHLTAHPEYGASARDRAMEVANPGANGGPLASPSSTLPGNPIDAQLVVDHLVDLLGVTLGASPEDLEGHGSLLSKAKKAETISRCQRFASDTQTVLYVLKDLIPLEHANGVNGSSGTPCAPLERHLLISRLSRTDPTVHLFSRLRTLLIAHYYRTRQFAQESAANRPKTAYSFANTGHTFTRLHHSERRRVHNRPPPRNVILYRAECTRPVF